MSKNTIFSFLKPKENKFFPMLNHLSEIINNAATTFIRFIKANDKAKMQDLYYEIKSYEREADELINVIFDELNKSFITPFDREDIHALCERLDDTIDFINSSSKRVLLFQPQEIPNSMVELCQIIYDCTVAITLAVKELKTVNKMPAVALEQCEKLHQLEHKADEVYEQYVKTLFETQKDSIELFKVKEIMQEMEKSTDTANMVGKIIKTIIVKYA